MKKLALMHFTNEEYLILKRKLLDDCHVMMLDQSQIKNYQRKYPSIIFFGIEQGLNSVLSSIKSIKSKNPFSQFIYCDFNPKTADIISLIKVGVQDFVQLPSMSPELLWVIEKTMNYQQLERKTLSDLSDRSVRRIQDDLNQNCSLGIAMPSMDLTPFLPLNRQRINKQSPVILLVEDNEIIRKGYALNLKNIGVVLEAKDIKSALTIIKSRKIHVVVIDIKLPDGTGNILISEIKKSQKNCEILIMSAYRDIDMMTQSLSLGADDYLLKSSDLTILRSKVAQSLKNIFLKDLHEHIHVNHYKK